MTSGPWWLSWVGCWGRSTAPSHKPRPWTWLGRYAPTDQSVNKIMIHLDVMETRNILSVLLFLFRWFTYLLERNVTSPTSRTSLKFWLLQHFLYFSKVMNSCKKKIHLRFRHRCVLSDHIYFFQVHGIILISQNLLCTFMLRLVEYFCPLICLKASHTKTLFPFFTIRSLRGSLICTFQTSWMLKHCFIVVSSHRYYQCLMWEIEMMTFCWPVKFKKLYQN